MAITPAPDIDDKCIDYTIEPGGGGGGNAVPQSFEIDGTAPIRINGGPSGDMSTSPMVISSNLFGSGNPGHVPASGGVSSNFLSADGTWSVPAGSGGYTTVYEETVPLIQRGAISFQGTDLFATDNAGTARTDVRLNRFTSITGGTVAPSGGGTTSFLRADGTWTDPLVGGGFVHLQTYPGTADAGSAHVSVKFGADISLISGSNSPLAASRIYAASSISDGSTIPTALFVRNNNAATGPSLQFWKSRGIEGAVTASLDNDDLGHIDAAGTNTALAKTAQTIIQVSADGNAGGTEQPTYVDLIGGSALTGFGHQRISTLGTILGAGAFTSGSRAASTVDIRGSLNLKRELFSGPGVGPFAVGAASCIYLADCSTTAKVFTLPSAVGIEGRIYGFIKTDIAAFAKGLQVSTTGGQLINGVSTGLLLNTQGEGFMLISDGSNWWTLDDTRKQERASNPSDIATVANTVVESNLASVYNDIDVLPGAVGWQYYAGKFSTTGTPTLRFRSSLHGGIVLDSTALTMPNNAANYPWMVEIRTVSRTVAAGDGTGRVVRAILHIGSSTGVLTAYSMLSNFGDMIVNSSGDSATLLVTWGTASASNTITATCAEGGASPNTMII